MIVVNADTMFWIFWGLSLANYFLLVFNTWNVKQARKHLDECKKLTDSGRQLHQRAEEIRDESQRFLDNLKDKWGDNQCRQPTRW